MDDVKSKIDQLRRKADKAAGALQEQMKQLKKEFGCKSLKEAEELLAKLEKEQKKLFETLAQELEAFEKEYENVLED